MKQRYDRSVQGKGLASPTPMFLIIDENVDDAVGRYLRERGHRVGFVRDLFAGGIEDPVIAVLGNEDSGIIVTHDKDFKGLVKRAPEGTRQRFRKLGRISLQCREPRAKQRIEELIESIEFEFLQVSKRSDQRFIVVITETSFQVVR